MPSVDPAAPLLPAPSAEPSVPELAGYGPAPASLLATVPYALRVWRRRRELVRALGREQQVYMETARRLRERLAALVERVVAEHPTELGEARQRLAAADELVRLRMAELEAGQGQLASRLAELEREEGRLAAERAQRVRDQSLAQVRVEDALQKRQQAEMEHGRVTSRLIAAEAAAEEAAEVGAELAPPEHARAIAELQQLQTRTARQLAARDAALRAAKEELQKRKRALGLLDDKRRSVAAQRRAAVSTGEQTHRAALAGIEQARDQRLALCEATLRMIHAERRDLLAAEQNDELEGVLGDLDRAGAELERHRQAVDAYDRGACVRGLALLAGGGALLLAALGWLL